MIAAKIVHAPSILVALFLVVMPAHSWAQNNKNFAQPQPQSELQVSPDGATNLLSDETLTPAPKHALEGKWLVTWVSRAQASQLVISHVQAFDGVTAFSGRMASPDGKETCPFSGNVVDQAKIQYHDSLVEKTMLSAAMVFIRGQCQNKTILLELFGLPSGKVLMNGRGALIDAKGNRVYEPVVLTRGE